MLKLTPQIVSWKMFPFFPLSFLILFSKYMRVQMLRQTNQGRSHYTADCSDSLIELLDGRLYYLNRSFEHNLLIQEIYLDIIKNKKTIHAKELKEYYRLFTNSKAEALMFEHIHHHNDNLDLAANHKEAMYSLKRLYCRLIEKIMVKISYYLMNKPSFNFAYAHASEMVKRCQILMRRLNNFKDLTTMDEVIERIFQENEEFQEHIFHQLIYKGYINSVDEFYRINGIDIEHRDVYERNKDTEQEGESQDDIAVEKKVKFKAKYEADLSKEGLSCLRKQVKPMNEVRQQAISNRAGMIELESKYKDLILSLDKIISQEQFEEITQVKQVDQNQRDEAEPVAEVPIIPLQPDEPKAEELHPISLLSNISHMSQRKMTTLRKSPSSKKNTVIIGQQFDARSELHKQEITIQSNSVIPDTAREKARNSSRKQTTPLFSKSFVNAIKSIEKSSLMEQPTRLSVKRMSEHIIQFQREGDKDSFSLSQKSSKEKGVLMQALKKSNQKKSIIKLLNIYKNRTLESYIGEARKELADSQQKYTQRDRRKEHSHERKQLAGNEEQGQLQASPSVDVLARLKDDPSIKRKILRNQSKASIFKQESTKRLKHLDHLKSQLKQNLDEPKTENMLKNFQNLDSKIKVTNKPSIFQNFRLSQKLTVSNLFKVTQRQDSSLRSSPEKVALQSTSILTSQGIESMDPFKVAKERMQRQSERVREKMSNTVDITPTQTPLFPHFEVYDRVRRVILK